MPDLVQRDSVEGLEGESMASVDEHVTRQWTDEKGIRWDSRGQGVAGHRDPTHADVAESRIALDGPRHTEPVPGVTDHANADIRDLGPRLDRLEDRPMPQRRRKGLGQARLKIACGSEYLGAIRDKTERQVSRISPRIAELGRRGSVLECFDTQASARRYGTALHRGQSPGRKSCSATHSVFRVCAAASRFRKTGSFQTDFRSGSVGIWAP